MLIGIHLPKTAGTSLREAIDRTPAQKTTAYLYPDPPGISKEQLLAEFPKRHRKTQLIYGHLRFGLHRDLGVEARYLTVLRQPLARALSIFRHHYRHAHSRWHELARAEGIAGLFSLPHSHFTMTRFLATDTDPSGPDDDSYYSGDALLALAKENLATSFAHIGLTEDLARDLPRFSQLIGHPLQVERDNADPQPLAADALSDNERRIIDDALSCDFELYEFAKDLREKSLLAR
ncbi:MAG: hypothetical protein AAF581_20785 [Planctomycetota bacterium]